MSAEVSLHHMRLVSRVAELASFTRAAEEQRLSQPALSRTVRDVERALQVRLFDRTTRSVQLTAEGREFVAVAREVLGAYDAGLGRFARYRAGLAGDLTVAALPSVAAHLLPPVVRDFLAGRPEVRLRILDGNTTEVLAAVRSGTADLAVTASPERTGDVDVAPLCTDPAVAVLPPAHRLAGRTTVTWADLAAEPFLAFAPGSSLRRLTDAAFRRAQVEPASLVETQAVGAAAGMVAAGLGVCVATEQVLPLMSFVGVVSRRVREPEAGRTLAVVTRRRPALSPPGREFAELLARSAAGAGGTPG
jgi:LysR family carnitine catabolism transcriptional activator